MRKVTTSLAAIMLATAGLFVVTAAPAQAACGASPIYAGVQYFMDTDCGTMMVQYNGDTMQNIGSGMSSVDVGVANGDGSWRVYLHSGAGSTGAYIGFSNASTTARKGFNLTNYGLNGGTWDNVPRSLCQIRVVGTSSNC